MRTRPDLDPPVPWSNGPLTLFHGTILTHWLGIARDGVSVRRGRAKTDFGVGFYATADQLQAVGRARQVAERRQDLPIVIWGHVERDALASLEALYFVRGHEGAEDFWSFVHHCRRGAITHARSAQARPLYDVVVGPVARNYHRRRAYENMDQISFHTPEAEALLNRITWSAYDPTR